MDELFDNIIIGSGLTGVHAAQTLVEANKKVLMLDVGYTNKKINESEVSNSFLDLRKNNTAQKDFILGKNLESIHWGDLKVGAQLTPSRQHIIKDVEKYLPIESSSFKPYQSLAAGGLGAAWGAGAYCLSSKELSKMGLNTSEIQDAYNTIEQRIGISGYIDDGSPYCNAALNHILPPVQMDNQSELIYNNYKTNIKSLNRNGIFLGRSNLAALTQDMGERKKLSYREMSFYDDHHASVYRSWMTLEELKKNKVFQYEPLTLVTHFKEFNDHIEVYALSTNSNKNIQFKCKRLILCPGVLGTTKILARSYQCFDRFPIMCNPYSYIPCLSLRRIGLPIEKNKTALSQLFLYHDPENTNVDVSVGAFYSYRSLMLFRLIKESPLGFRTSIALMRYLLSGISVLGLHHSEEGGPEKYLQLTKDNSPSGFKLKAEYIHTQNEIKSIAKRNKAIKSKLSKLGLIGLKTITPESGASIHYAGSLSNSQNEMSINENGQLIRSKNIFIADGSGFKFLPAKGLSLTLMANAHNVAKKIIEIDSK